MNHKHQLNVDSLGITFSSGTLAKLTNGAVVVQKGETSVLVTVAAAPGIRTGQDFFPLTVDYRERYSAAGRFPGGYFKREGKPTEREILISRLCDRPCRPLFPKGFLNEVQIIGQLLSTDLINDPDILMVNGASAALQISDIPWQGPVAAIRLADIDGEFVVNPTLDEQLESDLDLIYVGTETDMLMIEGGGEEYPEARFIEALEYAQKAIQPLIEAQKEFARLAGKQKKEFKLYTVDEEVLAFVREQFSEALTQAVFIDSKAAREEGVNSVKEQAEVAVTEKFGEDKDLDHVRLAFEILQEELYRKNILDHNRRVDGRGPADIRPISGETSVLPRVHGSSLFTRGETQALVTTTLGSSNNSQDLDALTGGASEKSFLLHYNFPPYSVGECGRFGFTSRREIGHGNLAERSLLPILPSEDDFPYAIRIVSDIMESNGSSSMASVCGGCLALMDAGVPITGTVAGISSGLVTETDENGNITRHVVLTDILGAEDHFGDMDFKISGTRTGITGFQLDLKIPGLPFAIAKEAIERVTQARYKILDIMEEILAAPRAELNSHAPRIHTIMIDPDKIGLLIGPGGKTIRRICEVSGAEINIDEDNSGRVNVFAVSKESMDRAIEEIGLLTAEIEVGKLYRGVVRGIKEFGVFVECLPGKEALVHISELADFRVENAEDVCKLGDEIWVKCIDIDDRGRVRLSRRAAAAEMEGRPYEPAASSSEDRPRRDDRPRRGGDDRGPRGGGRGGDRDRGPRGDRGGNRGDRGDRGNRGQQRNDRGPRNDRGNSEQGESSAPASE